MSYHATRRMSCNLGAENIVNFKRSIQALMSSKSRRNTTVMNKLLVNSIAETPKHSSNLTTPSKKYKDWTTYSDSKLTNPHNKHFSSRLSWLNMNNSREKLDKIKETIPKVQPLSNDKTINCEEDYNKVKHLPTISSSKATDAPHKCRQDSKTSVYKFKDWMVYSKAETRNSMCFANSSKSTNWPWDKSSTEKSRPSLHNTKTTSQPSQDKTKTWEEDSSKLEISIENWPNTRTG